MSDLSTLYERNRSFAETFDRGDLPIKPNIMTIVLTCVDARVDPSHFAGLGLGDALVMRNVGARATDTAMLEVSMLWQLMKLGSGGAEPPLGLAIIHHNDCGMARFVLPPVAEAISAVYGTEQIVETYGIRDERASVVEDVERARSATHTPPGLTISGHLYDITTGLLEEIVAPTSAR